MILKHFYLTLFSLGLYPNYARGATRLVAAANCRSGHTYSKRKHTPSFYRIFQCSQVKSTLLRIYYTKIRSGLELASTNFFNARNYHRIYINPVVSDGGEMMQQKTLREGKSVDGIHVEPFRKLASSHIAICDVN